MTGGLTSWGRRASIIALGALFLMPSPARAEGRAVAIDQVIARWWSAELGQTRRTHVIFARELAFEARLEAMGQGAAPDAPLADRHVRFALYRHVTEAMLEKLPLEPPASPVEVAGRAEQARQMLTARVGSEARLAAARRLEGLSDDELDALLRRTARASLYLERMVAPQLAPTELELREIHAAGQTPFSRDRFADVRPVLEKWVLGQRLAEALDAFFQRARSRITIQWAAPGSAL